MTAQIVRLFPAKYVPEILVGEEPVEPNVSANQFSKLNGKYPQAFWAEGWI